VHSQLTTCCWIRLQSVCDKGFKFCWALIPACHCSMVADVVVRCARAVEQQQLLPLIDVWSCNRLTRALCSPRFKDKVTMLFLQSGDVEGEITKLLISIANSTVSAATEDVWLTQVSQVAAVLS
jgi:hypothetical protein